MSLDAVPLRIEQPAFPHVRERAKPFRLVTSETEMLRWAEHLHGHAGWLTAVALLHPAIVLRRLERRAAWAVGLSTGLVTLVCTVGAVIYGPYRDRLKQGIFQTAPRIGWLFERKEHLAFAALAFAWVGAAAYVGAGFAGDDGHRTLRRLSHRAFVIAAGIAILVASLGTAVATYKTF